MEIVNKDAKEPKKHKQHAEMVDAKRELDKVREWLFKMPPLKMLGTEVFLRLEHATRPMHIDLMNSTLGITKDAEKTRNKREADIMYVLSAYNKNPGIAMHPHQDAIELKQNNQQFYIVRLGRHWSVVVVDGKDIVKVNSNRF